MKDPIKNFWEVRLAHVKKALEENNFEVHLADSPGHAKEVVKQDILSNTAIKTVSWGGSLTLMATGLYQKIKNDKKYKVLDVFDKSLPREEILELRRKALLVDLFITGSNAVTETGQLINLDMFGNRIGAITYGPKYVVILVGRNKIVPDVEDGVARIKSYAAPVNAMRLDKKTPCVKSGYCEECKSPDRICNTWTITEKSFPKGRIKVVLINEDLGF